MQPYIFPYIGYFQLVHAVDVFVFYDDVNFIKQGWINRNRIVVGGREHLFTVPVEQISSFRKIVDTPLSVKYKVWCSKFLKTLELEYGKAPYFQIVYPLIKDVLDNSSVNISELASRSVVAVTKYLGIETQFKESSSENYQNNDFGRADRLIDIIRKEKGNFYINTPGGKDLYSKEYFTAHGIELRFIESKIERYQQKATSFIAGLSIIDMLMNESAEGVREHHLTNYKLE